MRMTPADMLEATVSQSRQPPVRQAAGRARRTFEHLVSSCCGCIRVEGPVHRLVIEPRDGCSIMGLKGLKS